MSIALIVEGLSLSVETSPGPWILTGSHVCTITYIGVHVQYLWIVKARHWSNQPECLATVIMLFHIHEQQQHSCTKVPMKCGDLYGLIKHYFIMHIPPQNLIYTPCTLPVLFIQWSYMWPWIAGVLLCVWTAPPRECPGVQIYRLMATEFTAFV